MIQRTLVLLKPDAVKRGFCGEIITRFEKAALKIVGMKMVWVTKELSRKHYKAHVEKAFYTTLESTITEGPVVAFVLEGVDAVAIVRKLVGTTEPSKSPAGTIRGDYAHISAAYADKKGTGIRNLIHASGDPEEAKEEVAMWFKDDELHTYKTVHDALCVE